MYHIWPTSLGGPDTPDNHVHFTAKEQEEHKAKIKAGVKTKSVNKE